MKILIIPACLAVLLNIKREIDMIFNMQSTKQILVNYRYRIALERVKKGVIKNKINHPYNSNSSLLSIFSVWLTEEK
jgi:hypothetical protein